MTVKNNEKSTLVKQEREAGLNVPKVMEVKNLSDYVSNRVSEYVSVGRLTLPANYSVGNALSSAWLILQDMQVKGVSALQACTEKSVANALLDMTIMGHNPNKHGYFIAYGNKMTWFASYLGKSASLKRLDGFEVEPIGTLIYDGDEVELGFNEVREELIVSHKTSWKNKLSGKIVGAYATVHQKLEDDKTILRSAVMTWDEIIEAWTKNPSVANKREHVDFKGEFSKRTVINRLCKTIFKTSNDDNLLTDTIIKNEEQHYDFTENAETVADVKEEARKEIATSANVDEVVDFEDETDETVNEAVVEKAEVKDEVVETKKGQMTWYD